MHQYDSTEPHHTFALPELAVSGDKKRKITYHKSQLKAELEKRTLSSPVVLDVEPEFGLCLDIEADGFMSIRDQCANLPSVHYICGGFWKMFEKKNKLGEGTTGVVRRCVEVSSQKEFAVKIVRTRDEEIVSLVAAGNQLIAEFQNLRLLRHPNIIEVYELFIDSEHGYVYLLMEYFRSTEMFAYLQNVGVYSGSLASLRRRSETPRRPALLGHRFPPLTRRRPQRPQAEQPARLRRPGAQDRRLQRREVLRRPVQRPQHARQVPLQDVHLHRHAGLQRTGDIRQQLVH